MFYHLSYTTVALMDNYKVILFHYFYFWNFYVLYIDFKDFLFPCFLIEYVVSQYASSFFFYLSDEFEIQIEKGHISSEIKWNPY